MLKRSKHMGKIKQPMPHFAAWIARQLDFDIEVVIAKNRHSAKPNSVGKMKIQPASGDKDEADILGELCEENLRHFPDLEMKSGWVLLKKAKKEQKKEKKAKKEEKEEAEKEG